MPTLLKFALPTIRVALILFLTSQLYGQGFSDKFYDEKGWSVGIDLLPVVKSNNVYPRYSMLFVKRGAPWRLRSRIGFEFDRENSETEDLTNDLAPSKFLDKSIRAYASIGFERTLFREKRLSAIVAISAFADYSTDDRDGEFESLTAVFGSNDMVVQNYVFYQYKRNLDLGVSANLDIQYRVADRLSLRIESGTSLIFRNERSLGGYEDRSLDFVDSSTKHLLYGIEIFSALALIYSLQKNSK